MDTCSSHSCSRVSCIFQFGLKPISCLLEVIIISQSYFSLDIYLLSLYITPVGSLSGFLSILLVSQKTNHPVCKVWENLDYIQVVSHLLIKVSGDVTTEEFSVGVFWACIHSVLLKMHFRWAVWIFLNSILKCMKQKENTREFIVYIICGMGLLSGPIFRCEFRLIFSCLWKNPKDYF